MFLEVWWAASAGQVRNRAPGGWIVVSGGLEMFVHGAQRGGEHTSMGGETEEEKWPALSDRSLAMGLGGCRGGSTQLTSVMHIITGVGRAVHELLVDHGGGRW